MSHELSPRRSRQVAAAGLSFRRANDAVEEDIFRELSVRVQNGGEGWRFRERPWAPSFLPWLLSTSKGTDGPDVLLDRARDLCHNSKAVAKYREQWAAVEEDPDSGDAQKALKAAADEVAAQLVSDHGELEWTKHFVVEILPEAFGVAVGAAGGFLVAGPIGAIVGGAGGLVAKQALRPVQRRLWGWVIDQLPFVSARKLLRRAASAERDVAPRMAGELNIVWHRPVRKPS
jgi:hypothetical protein